MRRVFLGTAQLRLSVSWAACHTSGQTSAGA